MQIFRDPGSKFSVLSGKDGWLYIWEVDDIEKKLLGRTRLSDVELANTIRNIELRSAWCTSKQIQYVHLIAPDKASVYPQFLPDGVTIPCDNLLSQYRLALSSYSQINFIDVLPELKAEGSNRQVYFKTDSHWTYDSAYKIADTLLQSLKLRGVAVPGSDSLPVRRRNVKRILELGALCSPPVSEEFEILEPETPKSKQVFVSSTARGKAQVFLNENTALPKCVVLRDSFSSFFLLRLVEHFSTVVVLNSRHFWYDFIEAFEPDVVILEVAERFLHPPAFDLNNRGFEDFFRLHPDELLKFK